jgi:hypothetical protein
MLPGLGKVITDVALARLAQSCHRAIEPLEGVGRDMK